MVGIYQMGLAAVALALSVPVQADDGAIALGDMKFVKSGQAGDARIERFLGVDSVRIDRAEVILEGIEFSEGVIEFDIAFEDKFGFGGVFWHASDDGSDNEYFYIRQHKSGEPDAVQYTPMRGGLTSWQIYADANAIAPFAFTHEGWNHFKMIVKGDQADIYFNGSGQPLLHVPDLATDRGHGRVGFRATGPNGKFNIANLTIRSLDQGEGIVGKPNNLTAPPPGIIPRWVVSRPFAEDVVAGQLELPAKVGKLGNVATVSVEPFGILDLSRAVSPQPDADTVLVASRIVSDKARPVRLRFGYSDRLRLFLNGKLVFDGAADWRSRDYFFLGTIGFNDALILNLSKGNNLVQAAVSETFGGWGFAGAIEDREGLTIEPG